MRKTNDTQRFPHSALLFRFCLKVLETRKRGEKVHDQDVGNILNYNPSDTSHWKRGKKAVRSIYALEALSRTLDVDIEVIHDLSEGHLELNEAWFDFTEAEDGKRLTKALDPSLSQERFQRQQALEEVAQQILSKANISSVPVYLPEVLQVLSFLQVAPGDVPEKLVRTSRIKQGQYSIRYRKGEMRAHTRAAIAREIARVILYSEREQFSIPPKQEILGFHEMVDLSNALLVPRDALRAEISKVPPRVDLAKVLADVFWVPKSVIRTRLASLILEAAGAEVFHAEPMLIKLEGTRNPLEFIDLSEDDSGQPTGIGEQDVEIRFEVAEDTIANSAVIN
jgi:hypothetical protein